MRWGPDGNVDAIAEFLTLSRQQKSSEASLRGCEMLASTQKLSLARSKSLLPVPLDLQFYHENGKEVMISTRLSFIMDL